MSLTLKSTLIYGSDIITDLPSGVIVEYHNNESSEDQNIKNTNISIFENKLVLGTYGRVGLYSFDSSTMTMINEDTYLTAGIYMTSFGYSVSMNEYGIAVGAPTRSDWGSVLIYNNNLDPSSRQEIYDNNANSKGKGRCVSIFNDTILSGSEGRFHRRQGLDYIKYTGSSWGEFNNVCSSIHRLIDREGTAVSENRNATNSYLIDRNFGFAVSLFDGLAIVGKPEDSAIYIFNNVESLPVLNTDDVRNYEFFSTIGDDFGYSVCLKQNVVIVGAPANSNNKGKVYVYKLDSNKDVISSMTKTIIPESNGERFGHSVSMYYDVLLELYTIVVGAPEANSNTGKVYVYTYDGITDPIQIGDTLEGDQTNQRFGNSVSVYDTNVAIYSKTAAYVYSTATSEIIGDPYIKPMYDTMYKLPDINAYYRILESQNVKINAQVQKVDQEYINIHAKEINDRVFNDVNERVYNWQDMYFFTEICIHYKDEIVHMDLLKGCLLTECPSWLTLNCKKQNTENSFMYTNEDTLKVTELNIDDLLIIETALYNNPQILTGIKVRKSKESMDGLLMYKYRSKSAQVADLYDTCRCNFEKSETNCTVRETFYTNNGKRQTRCIDVV